MYIAVYEEFITQLSCVKNSIKTQEYELAECLQWYNLL